MLSELRVKTVAVLIAVVVSTMVGLPTIGCSSDIVDDPIEEFVWARNGKLPIRIEAELSNSGVTIREIRWPRPEGAIEFQLRFEGGGTKWVGRVGDNVLKTRFPLVPGANYVIDVRPLDAGERPLTGGFSFFQAREVYGQVLMRVPASWNPAGS